MTNITTAQARVLFAPNIESDRFLPEGPRSVVVSGREALVWVNIQTAKDSARGAVHLRFWDTGEHRSIPRPARPAFLVPTDRPDVVFVGWEKELGTLNLRTNEWTSLATIPDANPRTIINDGKAVPGGGAVIFGTKDIQFADPIAALYLFTLADRRVTVLAPGQTCSNGKVFAKDERGLLLFDIDTPRRTVERYRLDLDRRTVHADGVAVDLRGVDGFPDGMVRADERTAIVAIYNPGDSSDGHAIRYDLDTGKPLEAWTTPGSPRVTCPLLVERDGGVKLVLTTAVEGMPDGQRSRCPNAGDFFIAHTGLMRVPPVEVLRLPAQA
jgi:sugar lactone lactonase YvrE